MTQINDKLIKRIQKTLNLASSTNDHESQTALLLAQEMMAKHGLTMEDIQQGDDLTKTEKNVMEMYATPAGKTIWWKKQLSTIIAKNFRCYNFTRVSGGKSRIVFLGLEEDTRIAREVFLYACDAIEYFSNLYLNENGIEGLSLRNSTRNDYIEGFLAGLGKRFREQVVSNQYELILQKDALVEQHYSSLNVTKGSQSSISTSGDGNAYMAGVNDGKQMDHTKKVLK